MVAALVRQRRRLALASVAIALSVAYLAGALSLLDRVSAGLDNLAAAGAEHADLVVEGEVAYESALEQTRRLVPAGLVDPISSIDGVAAVSARFEEIAMVLRPDGTPVVAPGLSEQPIGTNWPDDEQMVPYRFIGDGRAPVGANEVVLDERTAAEAAVEVGDTVAIVGRSGPGAFEVVGIVSIDDGALPAGSSLALLQTDAARQFFLSGDNANRIAIRLEEGAAPAAVEAQIRSILPMGSDVVDAATAAEHRQEGLTRSFALIRILIVGFAALALVVGMGTVANSLTLLYRERRRTFAALRLVGARPRQLLTAALIEASMLAAVSALIGVPLGVVLGLVIEQGLGMLGTAVPVAGPLVSPSALVWAVLIGLCATILAAVIPAWRAGRVPPIEAVAEVPPRTESPARHALNVVIVSVGVAAAAVGLLALADVAVWIIGAVAGAILLGGLLIAVTPAALAGVVAVGIAVLPIGPATLRRIGARDAMRNRARTAATTAALLIATGVVAAIAVFLASFASSIDGDVNNLVRADLVVDSQTFARGGLPADLVEDIRQLDEVAAVSGWQRGEVTVGDIGVRLTGVDGATLDQVMDPGWSEDSATTVSGSGIALSTDAAERLGVHIGDMVPVLFHSGGVENLVVEGIYDRATVLLGDAMIDRAVLTSQIAASVDLAALVTLEEDTPEARAALDELAREYGVTAILEPTDFVDSRSDLLTGFERVIQWMLLFTLLQALIGVINTLLMSVGERRREFGLLRFAGASPRQLHRMVLGEGVAFSVVGTALGLVVGVLAAVAAVRALNSYGISGVSLPVAVLVVAAFAAMALGILASVVPAAWAAAIPPLEAVADAGAAPTARGGLRALFTARQRHAEPIPATEPVPAPEPALAPEPPPAPAAGPTVPGPPPYRGPQQPGSPFDHSESDAAAPTEPTVSTGPGRGREPVDRPGVVSPAAGWLREELPDGSGEAAPDSERVDRTARDRRHPRSPFEPAPLRPTSTRSQFGSGRGEPVLDPAAQLRLHDVLGSMTPDSRSLAAAALGGLARSLSTDEVVETLVQGWTRGLLCLVARTDQRVVVVIDRFPEPIVESLDLSTTQVSVFGPPGSERVSVAVLDGRRLLEVTGVRDRVQAAAMVSTPRVRRTRRREYF